MTKFKKLASTLLAATLLIQIPGASFYQALAAENGPADMSAQERMVELPPSPIVDQAGEQGPALVSPADIEAGQGGAVLENQQDQTVLPADLNSAERSLSVDPTLNAVGSKGATTPEAAQQAKLMGTKLAGIAVKKDAPLEKTRAAADGLWQTAAAASSSAKLPVADVSRDAATAQSRMRHLAARMFGPTPSLTAANLVLALPASAHAGVLLNAVHAAAANAATALTMVAAGLGLLVGHVLGKETLQKYKDSDKPNAYAAGRAAYLVGGAALAVGATKVLVLTSPVAALAVLAGALITGLYLRRKIITSTKSLSSVEKTPTVMQSLKSKITKAAQTPSDPPLFNVRLENKTYLMDISKDQLDKEYLLSLTLERGIGAFGLYSGTDMGNVLVSFKRVEDEIQLTVNGHLYRAKEGSPMEHLIQRDIPGLPLSKAKIKDEDASTGKITIALDRLFLGTMSDLKGDIQDVKTKPKNVEIRAHYDMPFFGANVPLTLRYSLSARPDTGYQPRAADDRINHFVTVFEDWTDIQKKDLSVRVIDRWHLEKTDPKAELSPVKNPIVYWLDDSIPAEYKPAVKRAVLNWNKAFEKIGYKDAVVVKEPSQKASQAARWWARVPEFAKSKDEDLSPKEAEEADYDPSDARFNVIKWFISLDSIYAIGPHRSDPLTGQIYNAGIGFAAPMARMDHVFDLMEGPRSEAMPAALKTAIRQKRFGEIEAARKTSQKILDKLRALTPASADRSCHYARELAQEAAIAWARLEAGSHFTPEQKKKFIDDYIVSVLTHEVGHTLGFRHNFQASTVKSLEALGETTDGVLSGTVMDYNPPNIAAPGEKQGDFFQTELGPQDYLSVAYAYGDTAGMSPEQEKTYLAKIAAQYGPYATDEDIMSGIDPRVQYFDLGKEPLDYARRLVKLARDVWERFETAKLADGEKLKDLQDRFALGASNYRKAVSVAAQYIGGFYVSRSHEGEGRVKFSQPVPAATQREVLSFINENVFSDKPFALSPDFISRLAPDRQATVTDPYPILELLDFNAVVLWIRKAALGRALNADVLGRMVLSRNMVAEGTDVFTIRELFDTLTSAIWSEVGSSADAASSKTISALRRDLQREYLGKLIGMIAESKGPSLLEMLFGMVEADPPAEAKDMARRTLTELRDRIKTALQDKGWDKESRAHLDSSLSKIKTALSSKR